MAEKHHIDWNQPLSPAARRRLGPFLAPILLLILTAGFFWKLALTDQYVWFDHPDMAFLEIPRLEFQAREIHRGRFPFWDPFLWSGQPLIGQTQPGPLYPMNLLFYLLPLDGGYLKFSSLNWYFVILHFQAALFCYWLLRDLRRSRAASLVGGCLFAFGGFLGTVAWLDVMNNAVWTPLVFLFLLRAIRGQRPVSSAALSGVFMGLSWLAGHHEIPLLVGTTAALTWLWHARKDRRLLGLMAFSFLVCFLISAAQTLPTFEFGKTSKRWIGADEPVAWKDPIPYTIPTVYSMPARGFLGIILPGQGRFADSSSFLGIVAFSLAILGLVSYWRDPVVRWLAVVTAAAAVYALGAATPIHGVVYALVPILNKARIPMRAIHVFNFSLVVLAAYGLDQLLEKQAVAWTARLRWALAGLALLLVVASWKGETDDRILLAAFVAGALAALLAAWPAAAITRRALYLSLFLLALIELTPTSTATFASRFDKGKNTFSNHLKQNKDIADFLKAQPQPVRVAVNDTDIPTNFGDLHGIDMLQGYMAGLPLNLLRLEMHTQRTQSLFGVTHSVGKKPDRPDQVEVFTGQTGVKVYRVPDAMPRVWAVHEAVKVKEDWEVRVGIADPAFDFHRKAIIMSDIPALETCPGSDDVKLTRRNPDRVTIHVNMACRGLVIQSETWYPGWTATIDGRPAEVYEVFGAIRGVVVGAGNHVLELHFRPKIVYFGAFLTLFGAVLTAFVIMKRQ